MRKLILVLVIIVLNCSIVAEAEELSRKPFIYADDDFTIAIDSEGKIRYTGAENYIFEDFKTTYKDRTDIVDFAFYPGLAGLTDAGKIIYSGEVYEEAYEQCGAFCKVVASSYYTAGLREDGTAVAISNMEKSKYVTFPWDNIVDIEFLLACPNSVICAIRSDGSVGMAWVDALPPYDIYFQEAPELFSDIIKLDGQHEVLIGLKKDKTVVAYDYFGEREIPIEWNGIVDVASNSVSTLYGLKENGIVVKYNYITGDRGELVWNDIVSITAGSGHIVGISKDGKLYAEGSNKDSQCNVESWDLTPLAGDANDDNEVNAKDALAILKVAAQIDNFGTEFLPGQWSPENAKLTSGSLENINSKDALEVLKIVAKIK